MQLNRSTFLAALPLMSLTTGVAGAQTASPAVPTPLRVGATANDTYAEAYYGVDTGIFAKAGLDVTISTFANGAAVAAGVASGALDLGVTNPVQIANAIANGIPFAYFAGGGLYSSAAPTTLLVVAKASPLHTARDLEGMVVANSTLKDLTQLAAETFLTQGGADVSKVKMIEMPFAEMGPALQRGTVQAAVLSEPSLTAAILAGQVRSFGKIYDAFGPRFYISGWFSTRSWLSANASTAARYAKATYDVARWGNANHEQSGKILAKYSKIAADVASHMTRCTYAESLNPALLDPVLSVAAKAKLTSRPVTSAEIIAAGA
ncbi:MAG: ABC transporter substrate-binding protein [Candidatus Lustribacter sp.]